MAFVGLLPTNYASAARARPCLVIRRMNHRTVFVFVALALGVPGMIVGCGSPTVSHEAGPIHAEIAAPAAPAPVVEGVTLQAVDLNDPYAPAPVGGPVALAAAKNEWTNFAVKITGLPPADGPAKLALTVRPFNAVAATGPAAIDPAIVSYYQVLPMPVDVNRAGYVRHTGLSAGDRVLPRALLPLASRQGAVRAADLRDPAHATSPAAHAGGDANTPVLLWVDVHVPAGAKAGDYAAACDLTVQGGAQPVASVPLRLKVYDFALPDERHLRMVSQVDWDGLERLYPAETEAVTPRLVNRRDAVYAPIVSTLDALVDTAQENRANVVVPRLQPTVKWKPGEPPEADWDDFDSLLTLWMSGEAFGDKVPLAYWPLPALDYLSNFDPRSQQQYWNRAAVHFSQRNWLSRSAVFLENAAGGQADDAAARDISAAAARALASHPLLRVTVPLEDEQLVLASAASPDSRDMIEPRTTDRLAAASPGLVFAPPARPWPAGVARPEHWLRADQPGLVPYAGAGADERDVRLWAWLAYLRGADLVLWSAALPAQNDPNTPADPNTLVWFYPGSWFGVPGVVPGIQLKWLRRAQQDYEYLWLAGRGGRASTRW